MLARLRFASIMPQAGWAACLACGAMCRAAWAWSRSISATRRASRGDGGVGCPCGGDCAGRRRAARKRRAHCGAHHRVECRSARDAAACWAGRRWSLAREGRACPIEGCTVKLNVHLRELPNFTARPGTNEPHHYGQINAPLTKDEWKAGFAAARRGELPEHLWCELYFQSVHDGSVAPAGTHTMSVFAQYVPYKFARGNLGRKARRSARAGSQFPCPLLLEHRQRRD
jgi:hypothetical protein